MTLAQFVEVWTPLSTWAAVVSGFLMGFLVIGYFASDPTYASTSTTPARVGVLTAVLVLALGMVFYGLQIFGSYLDGDTTWTRVVSRFGLWVLYGLAIGFGTWVRLQRHLARKHVEVHDRAVHELEAER